MAHNEIPGLADLLVNYEDRLNQLEYQVDILQKRPPKSRIRRVFWWIYSVSWLVVPIIGGIASIFGEEPWKDLVVIGAFGCFIGKTITDFALTVSQGPRPHRSMLMDDHR